MSNLGATTTEFGRLHLVEQVARFYEGIVLPQQILYVVTVPFAELEVPVSVLVLVLLARGVRIRVREVVG